MTAIGVTLRLAAGLLLSALLVFGLVQLFDIDPQVAAALLGRIDGRWLLLALALQLVSVGQRGVRIRWIEGQARYRQLGAWRATAALAVHQSANHILPMRLGELTWVTLTRALGLPGVARGLGVTVLMRLADLFGLAVVVAGGALLSPLLPAEGRALVLGGAGAAALAVGAILLLGPAVVGRVPQALLSGRLGALLDGFLQAWRAARGGRRLAALMAESAGLWVSVMMVHWALGRAVGLDLDPASMAVGALGSVVMGFLPVGAAFNLGTMEVGWAATLALVGHAPADAAVYGFGVHVGLVLVAGFYGLVGLLLLAPGLLAARVDAA